MPALVSQPTALPTRKVLASTLATTLGAPVVGWGCLQLLGFELTPDCAGQISEGILYAVLGLGGALSGLATFLAGYFAKERTPPAG